jgi:hypothetical protein
MKPKFNIGDKVKVIKYGHPAWSNVPNVLYPIIFEEDDGWKRIDMMPELVGEVGIVSIVESHLQNNNYEYALKGISRKHAWYNEEQLELINANPNTLEDE